MEVIAVVVGSFVLAGGFLVIRTAKRVIQHKRMARSCERDQQDAYYNNNYLSDRKYPCSQQYVPGDQKDFEPVPVPRHANQPQIQYDVASSQQRPLMYADQKIPS